jgi:hypothetical protein
MVSEPFGSSTIASKSQFYLNLFIFSSFRYRIFFFFLSSFNPQHKQYHGRFVATASTNTPKGVGVIGPNARNYECNGGDHTPLGV